MKLKPTEFWFGCNTYLYFKHVKKTWNKYMNYCPEKEIPNQSITKYNLDLEQI